MISVRQSKFWIQLSESKTFEIVNKEGPNLENAVSRESVPLLNDYDAESKKSQLDGSTKTTRTSAHDECLNRNILGKCQNLNASKILRY